eukprot:1777301-Rhodomonas_salina.1
MPGTEIRRMAAGILMCGTTVSSVRVCVVGMCRMLRRCAVLKRRMVRRGVEREPRDQRRGLRGPRTPRLGPGQFSAGTFAGLWYYQCLRVMLLPSESPGTDL